MGLSRLHIIMSLMLISLLTTSCARNRDEMWEDSKSCKRHVGRGFQSLGGKHGQSRQVGSADEFTWGQEGYCTNDFIPLLNEQGEEIAMGDMPQQSIHNPGEAGGRVPGIDAFQDPSHNPALAGVFRTIHFDLNSNLIKGEENFQIVTQIANYMKSHPNTYIFVEGHCDERGAEAYNLALGSRRSNTVRNMLISEGANPDNIFTISYGAERPVSMGHDEDSWGLNRRADFKVYGRG